MPIDDEVSQAVSPLHFGMTLPLWDHAVRLQLARLQPREDQAVRVFSMIKRRNAGVATSDDEALYSELEGLVRVDQHAADSIYLLSLNSHVLVDATFLLIAVRGVLTMADRIVKQMPPGKGEEEKRARDAFVTQFEKVKYIRDAVIHYDEYAIGAGQKRDLIIDSNEGAGVGQDDDGYLLFKWAGHEVRLLDAARAALVLSVALTKLFFVGIDGSAIAKAPDLPAD
jgi:hypothetical protein